MIVCSKRVYLNILTQLLDVNTLLNANYYIADQTTRNGLAQLSDNITMNEDGCYTINPVVINVPAMHPYHILYNGDVLSPIALMSQLMLDNTGQSVESMFKQQLMNNDSLTHVYDFMYKDKPKGNGLRILLFVNDSSTPYIHIVCEYLSEFFGEDITFIDKQYRNDIIGQVQYQGNKQRAMQVFREIRDYQLLKSIVDLASNYQYGFNDNTNLDTFFETMEVPQLFYTYERLFPNEPLPVGNYTKDHMMHIITSKLQHIFPQQNGLSNLMIPSFADMASLYNGISDEEIMSTN